MKTVVSLFTLLSIFSCSRPKPPEISYHVYGEGERVLLFIHGWCINGSYWKNQVDAFQDRYRVITVDLAGHGDSKVNRTDWSFDRYADDIVDIVKFLDLKNVVLIGHSMAGSIITRVANKEPDRIAGVIGVDNFKDLSAPLDSNQLSQTEQLMDLLRKDYRNTAVEISRATLFSPTTDSSVVARVLNDVANANSQASIASIESVMNEYQYERKFLKGLKIPLYLINSDVSPTNVDSLERYCGDSVIVKLVAGTGHYPMIEKPAEFNNRLHEILNEMK